MDLAPNFAGTLMGISNCVATLAGVLAPFQAGYIINQQVGGSAAPSSGNCRKDDADSSEHCALSDRRSYEHHTLASRRDDMMACPPGPRWHKW